MGDYSRHVYHNVFFNLFAYFYDTVLCKRTDCILYKIKIIPYDTFYTR